METKSVSTSKKKILIASGITILIISAGIAYYLYSKHKKKKAAISFVSGVGSSGSLTTSGSASSSTSGSTSVRLCQSKSYPINYGTCIDDVKILQRLLQKKGADLGSPAIDGKFGPKTKVAAQKYLGKTSFNLIDISSFKKQLNA